MIGDYSESMGILMNNNLNTESNEAPWDWDGLGRNFFCCQKKKVHVTDSES